MNLIVNILVVIGVILSVILHEISHGYTAYLMGDNTAKRSGRLSLNPIKHIDLYMTVLLPLVLKLVGSSVIFGAAKPVPVNTYNFKNRSRGMALTAISGPVTNILISLVLAFLCNIVYGVLIKTGENANIFWLVITYKVMVNLVVINLFLAFFNMLPIPPLDGSRVLRYFLPDDFKKIMDQIEKYGMAILFLIIYFADPLFDKITQVIMIIVKGLLVGL